MTVGELLALCSSLELSEWAAYVRLEPFGEVRADLRSAIVATVIANVNRDRKKRRKAYTPLDFMPFPEEEPKKKKGIPISMLPLLKIVFGGKVTTKGKDDAVDS